ncbi:hypothetical protein ACFQH6_06070 [Halobacteriaceae archaeon GCM10025711]
MNTTKVGLGALLLLVSSGILFASSTINSGFPLVLAAGASLGMAAGALLVGTSADGRPV